MQIFFKLLTFQDIFEVCEKSESVLSLMHLNGPCSGGSDWRTVKLKQIELETGDTTDLEDVLEHVKFSPIAWTHDNKVRCLTAPALAKDGLHIDLIAELRAHLSEKLRNRFAYDTSSFA